MSSKGSTGIPALPRPNGEVTVDYLNQLVAAVEFAVEALGNDGPLQGSALNISLIGANPNVLRTGDVFEENGFLKITRINLANTTTNLATTAVGTVTVLTP